MSVALLNCNRDVGLGALRQLDHLCPLMVGKFAQTIWALQFLKRKVARDRCGQMTDMPFIRDKEDKVVAQLAQPATVLALTLINRRNQLGHLIDDIAYAEGLVVNDGKTWLTVPDIVGHVKRTGRERDGLKGTVAAKDFLDAAVGLDPHCFGINAALLARDDLR